MPIVLKRISAAALALPVLTAAVLLAPRQAVAAAFQLHENSAEDVGDAFSGAASSADTPATVFNNPAGMTQLPGLQVALGASLIDPSFSFTGTSVNALGQPISGNSNNGGHAAAAPNAYVSYQVSPDITVGLALTAPYGLADYYGPDFVGRYQADKTELESFDLNPAIAWKVTPWLSLGAGFSANYSIAEFSTQINSESILASVLPPSELTALGPQPDGLFNLRGHDWAFGYNFGALIQPVPGTNIGLTYRSRINHDYASSVTYDVPPALAGNPAFTDTAARAKLTLPDNATISLTQVITPRLTGYAGLQWTNWSQFKTLSAYTLDGSLITSEPVKYHDSVLVTIGASYKLTERWTLRGGTGFDQTPTHNAYRDPRVPDGNRVLLAVGASYKVAHNATVDLGYLHEFIPSNAPVHDVSATGDVLSGYFSGQINVVSLETRFTF